MKKPTKIVSYETTSSSILGTYDGECADSTVTNKNGLDITRPVWENVFASDEYKEGIEHGWYIGYLGHPEDPGYQNFQEACIVMTSGYIDDDGIVHGTFNLIDTPVGRIVKAFQDAGVVFGISVRGAGDIYDNSVDPDTFVFRGFDLVAFPAYSNAVPKYSQIAASTDINTVKRLKKICASLDANLGNITSIEALKCLQSQFAEDSDQYKMIESRKKELSGCDEIEDEVVEETEDISGQKLEAMTQLYLNACVANRNLVKENENLKHQIKEIQSSSAVKLARIQAITSAQNDEYQRRSDVKVEASKKINMKLKQEIASNTDQIERYERVVASKNTVISNLRDEVGVLKSKVQASDEKNLKYSQKVKAAEDKVAVLSSELSRIKAEKSKTVAELSAALKRASNLDAVMAENKELENLLASYQSAYASLYASAIGADLDSIQASVKTSVADIRRLVSRSSITASRQLDDSLDIEECDVYDDSNELVTI